MKSYNAGSVDIVINGSIAEGLADGTFLTVSRQSDSFTFVAGADGETARAKTNDKSALATLTTMQTSSLNDVLSILSQLDERTGDGVFSFGVIDRSGRTIIAAARAYIVKPADVEFAKEISNREWSILLSEADIFVGGSDNV